jgi:amino-acid N-acetyltransferase
MNIVPASQNNFSSAIELLKENNLPTEDINPATELFVLEENNCVLGTVAVEHNADTALLRSLAVSKDKRNNGLGEKLVSFIEERLAKNGIQEIYLLTTTASEFFTKRGYEKMNRNDAAPFIKSTAEFSSLCSSSAIVMKKQLAKEKQSVIL